ncbi:uncharacterized protein KD926_006929 [Aspergillus affinis]|uniref:uncharacterized protein n=1 Tax=Aspergillus affinis TaxID=1070780 RepID=UPI0022FE739C|nr:uncharacterized protein KD926_006929 [Aspergillus affinis]KAI9041353.1 hypothetical protein KD926_006929 [Aspergillus affinis]
MIDFAMIESSDSALVSSSTHPTHELDVMFDFDFLADLPADTPRVVASTLNSIKSAIRRNLQHPYIVIDYVNPDIVERLVESPRLRFLKASRLFYDADLRKLILKIPSTFHDGASRAFHNLLTRHMESSGVDEEVVEPQGSGRVKDGPYSKEPDESYLPVRPIPGRDPKWPTLVVEVGYSATLGRLRVDCRWWLGRSQGQVKIALLLSIDRDRPHILIEKWENGPATYGYNFRVPGRLSPQKTAAISVTLENDEYVTTGAPLCLSVDDIVLPLVPGSVPPCQIIDHDFEKLARAIWRKQGFVARPT